MTLDGGTDGDAAGHRVKPAELLETYGVYEESQKIRMDCKLLKESVRHGQNIFVGQPSEDSASNDFSKGSEGKGAKGKVSKRGGKGPKSKEAATTTQSGKTDSEPTKRQKDEKSNYKVEVVSAQKHFGKNKQTDYKVETVCAQKKSNKDEKIDS